MRNRTGDGMRYRNNHEIEDAGLALLRAGRIDGGARATRR
jgi:hypothetical protein